MGDRYCVCGKLIDTHKTLCADCFNLYGADRVKWPVWLIDWAKSMQNEYRQKKTDSFVEYNDEIISDEAVHNLARAKKYPEMDFEEFAWFNQ